MSVNDRPPAITISDPGYVTGRVRLLPSEDGGAEIDEMCRDILKLAIDKVGTANFPDPIKLNDPAWITYRLAEILPIDTIVKQELLEMDDSGSRFARLRKILEQQGIAN